MNESDFYEHKSTPQKFVRPLAPSSSQRPRAPKPLSSYGPDTYVEQ